MKLKVLDFIKEHNDWEQILSQPPYSISIKRDDGYILLKYSQIESDFSIDIVRECRGLILRESDYEVVCWPFTKFFNVGEEHADKIDWESAKVQEKIDGSLIKMWCDTKVKPLKWRISTNGTIDAFKAKIESDFSKFETFGELFSSVLSIDAVSQMDFKHTYMFELVSPYNKVVVYYPETAIYHIGTRDNITGQEVDEYIGVEKPREFPLKTEEEVVNAAKELPFNEEGYVAVDKNYKRVKIKSPEYVKAHGLISGGLTKVAILDLIRANEQSEILSYFPEYSPIFQEITKEFRRFSKNLMSVEKSIRYWIDKGLERKEFANIVISKYKEYSSFAFQLYDNKIPDYKEYIGTLKSKKIVERFEEL